MSVHLRIFIPMIVTTFLVSAAVLVSNSLLFSQTLERDIMKTEIESMMVIVKKEIKSLEEKSNFAAFVVSSDEKLNQALDNNNLAAINERLTYLYDYIFAEICLLVDADGQVITRVDGTEGYITDLSALTSIKAALSGEPCTTVEQGINISMVVSTAIPMYDKNGEIRGAAVTGYQLSSEEFVDKMKEMTGCEFVVYKDMHHATTTFMGSEGKRVDRIEIPGSVVNAIHNNRAVSRREEVGGYRMRAYFSPLNDYNKQVVGMLFTGQHLDKKTPAVRKFTITGLGLSIFIIGLCSYFVWKTAKAVSRPIEESINKILYDPLTGLHNRRYLDEKLQSLLKTLSRSNSYMSVIMMDIDCFKLYNDNYGHSEGDNCLKAVADVLIKCVDRADDFVVRYGGEEFTVVLPNTNEAGAKVIAKKILDRIRAKAIPHEKSLVTNHVTLSLGAVTGRVLPSHTPDDYIRQADELLYTSKQNGRNRYTLKSF